MLTPRQHCPPTARQAPSPQPSRHRCGSQDRGPAPSPRPPESEAFPEPVWRLHSDLSPLSLPVYSTPWQKAAGGEFMRSGAKGGAGNECGLMKRRGEGGKRDSKEKATRTRVCMRKRKRTELASPEGLVCQDSAGPGRALLRLLRCTADAPVRWVGEQVSGSPGHSQVESSWGRCSQEPPTLLGVSATPAPYAVKPQETQAPGSPLYAAGGP